MDRRKIDFIVGLFLLGAVTAVIIISLRAANLANIGGDGGAYRLRLLFDNIGSLNDSAPVKSSGVLVGRVRAIRYDGEEYRAEVDVAVENRFRFPTDSDFSIVSSNLLGDQYISIEPGGEEDFLESGESIVGNSALVLEDLIGKFLLDTAEEAPE